MKKVTAAVIILFVIQLTAGIILYLKSEIESLETKLEEIVNDNNE